MIIGYARVSTSNEEQDTSIEAQQQQLKMAGCLKVITERRSAFKRNITRKGWEQCKTLICSGEVTRFVIVSLSRASRQSQTREMSLLCDQHSVEFVCLDGSSVDVTTPQGLLNVGIMDTVNETDSLIKSIRTKQGNAHQYTQGRTAVGKCPFGYHYQDGKPCPDPKQWKAAKKLWQRLADAEFVASRVLRDFAHEGKPYTYSTTGILRWIRNPILRGEVRYPGPCPIIERCEPLISAQEQADAVRLVDSRAFIRGRRPRGQTRLFSSVMTCKCCGNLMQYAYANKKRRLKCLNPRCDWYGKGIAESKVREQVIEALKGKADDLAKAATTKPAATVSAEELERQANLKRLLEMQQSGVPGLEPAINALKKQASASELPDRDWSTLAAVLRVPGLLDQFTDAELRKLVLDFVSELLYAGNAVKVEITIG